MSNQFTLGSGNPAAERRAIRAANSEKRAKQAEKLRLEGNASFMKGDLIGAADLYARAINIHGPKPIIMGNLAAAYLKLELYDEAEWAATTALEYDPCSVKARYRRAMARKGLTRYKAAKIDLKYMLALDPTHIEAKRELKDIEELMKTNPGLPLEPNEEQPHNDDLPWPLLSESETEDCKHLGNYTACRFYNHSGCSKGSQCKFSHAPDAKSVRDEVGKNVCLHFLMGDCQFGGKCLYSHSKRYLPPQSWWDDPAQLAAAEEALPYVDDLGDYAELHDILLKIPGARTYAAFQESEVVVDHVRRQLSAAKVKLANRKPLAVPAERAPSAKVSQSSEKFVMVLSLAWDPTFADMHAHLFAGLEKKITVKHIRNIQAEMALPLLDSPSLVGVLVTDPGITKREHAKVLNKLVAYVKNGGVATIGGIFTTFIRPPDFAKFFKTSWGLDWTLGSYFRSDFSVNTSNDIVKKNPSLTKRYSMKATHISGIRPEMAIYHQTDDSFTQSLVFPPLKTRDISDGEAPAVCATVGKGRLCVLGDVNEENESTNTVLAMLGVLDEFRKPQKPVTQPQASSSSNAQKTDVKNNKSSEAAPNFIASKLMEAQRRSETQVSVPDTKLSDAQKSREESAKDGKADDEDSSVANGSVDPGLGNKFVLLLELEGDTHIQTKFRTQISALGKKIKLKTAYEFDIKQIFQYLASPDLHAVYLIDEGIQNIQNMVVLTALQKYVHKGGLVVFGGFFGRDVDSEAIHVIVQAFGLNWTKGTLCRCKAKLNECHETAKRNTSLSDAFYMTAAHLRGFRPEHLLYDQRFDEYDTNPNFRPPGGGIRESPVLRARYGEGFVGYIGDVVPAPETTDILFAMLELPKTTPPKPLEPYSKKFLVMLMAIEEPLLQRFIPGFMKDIRGKLEVVMGLSSTGLSSARIVDLLPSKDLIGVFIADTSVLHSDNAYLFSRLVEYSKNGGTVVFGWQFCRNISTTVFRALFNDNWGLQWQMVGSEGEYGAKRNFENTLFKGKRSEELTLPKKTRFDEAIHISGIKKEMAVYCALTRKSLWDPEKGIYRAGAVFADVEKGHLGYIGAGNLEAAQTRDIIYTMFGLA